MRIHEGHARDRWSYGVLGYQFRGRRRLHEARLHEDAVEAIKAYNEVWISAVEFFTRERDDLIDLPPDSSERLFVEGVLGILRQHEMDIGTETATADDVRAESQRVASALEDMREGASDDLRAYVDRLVSGMRELHNRIDPESVSAGAEDEEPTEPEEGDAEAGEDVEADVGDERGGKAKGEEEPEDEKPPEPENPESIAQALGLNK